MLIVYTGKRQGTVMQVFNALDLWESDLPSCHIASYIISLM